jgi:hypothetical protein
MADIFVDVENRQLDSGTPAGTNSTESGQMAIGKGSKVFRADQSGIWLGAEKFTDAPFSVDMEGNVVATSADFSASGYTKINIFKQTGIPTAIAIGDLWFDTDDGNKLYRSGAVGATTIAAGQWEVVRDTTIADAQSTADSKIVTFLQDAIPTSVSVGDIWIDTNDGNKMYRAASVGADQITAGEWVLSSTIGITVFAQDAIPTSTAIGDIWYDTNDGNKQYRAASVGATTIAAGAWVLVSVTGISIFAQDAIPTSVSIGDIWYDTNDNNRPYRAASVGADQITAGEWVLIEDLRAADALLKAGTSQTLSGNFNLNDANVLIDGANKRILISDGTDDRILIGYQSGGF